MSDLAKQVLSGCYARANELLVETCPAADNMLTDQEKRQEQRGIPRPQWQQKYMQPEQAEQPPGEGAS